MTTELIAILKKRFEENPQRHLNISWPQVEERLVNFPAALETLRKMEESGGEPDVIDFDEGTGQFIYADCSPETPEGRRSLCYDDAARASRKKNPPMGSAVGQAQKLGIRLLDESLYRRLQSLGQFDLKTSSWIETPEAVRKLGGALFMERRYDKVFVFYNGADSYYSVRGWRGYIRI